MASSDTAQEIEIKKAVRERYAGLAQGAAGCCGDGSSSVAVALYTKEELANLPLTVTEAAAGCGNPMTESDVAPGETVLDLGSGGGIDCFRAARLVGPEGRVIGVDMTPEMVALATDNSTRLGVDNVEFRLGEIERMPVDDGSVDLVISNCVINLSPDKDAVFREAFRALRPGGRLSVSDIVLMGELSEAEQGMDSWTACIAGALPRDSYLAKLASAGFVDIEAVDERLGADGCGGQNATSLKVKAVKPGGSPR
jgi:arsenite methyltransferase